MGFDIRDTGQTTRGQGENLLKQVCTLDNLRLAWRRVRSNKGVAGVDNISLADYEKNIEQNLLALQSELADGTYSPDSIRWFLLPKSSGGARRVGVLAVRDRVAQRAVLNILEPVLEPLLPESAFGFRPSRSTEDAAKTVEELYVGGKVWVAKADIADFFDSISQPKLIRLLSGLISDKRMIALIEQWLQIGALEAELVPRPQTVIPRSGGYSERLATGWQILGSLLTRSSSEFPFFTLLEPAGAANPSSKDALRRLAVNGPAFFLALPQVRRFLRRSWGDLFPELLLLGAVAGPHLITRLAEKLQLHLGLAGTPQGSAISPLLSNLYLLPFDRDMQSQGFHVVRYGDDFVIMCSTRLGAWWGIRQARRRLRQLGLRLREEKVQIVKYESGFRFLGFDFPREREESL